jgi:hypothetical protein
MEETTAMDDLGNEERLTLSIARDLAAMQERQA